MITMMVMEENYDYHSVFSGDTDMVLMMMMRNSDIKGKV
jgi:hypothetical protein